MPVGDRDALAAALLDLVGDDERRRRMGRAALENAHRFAPGPVVAQAERLLDEAVAAGGAGRPGARGRAGRALCAAGASPPSDAALAAASGALRIVRKGQR